MQCDTDDEKHVCLLLFYENSKTGETSLSLVMFGTRHCLRSSCYAFFSSVAGSVDVEVLISENSLIFYISSLIL